VTDWPLFDLRLRCRDVQLAPVREADLPDLAAREPDDYELDPRLEHWPAQSPRQNRQRLFRMTYWTALGTWSPRSWVLHLAVRAGAELVGVQTLEAADFPVLRTVDTASWLVPAARGRGIGVAMRTAVLGLAFDHLGALAAVSSARLGNAASLGVSRRIGYLDNGVGFVSDGHGRALLQHLRLPVEHWRYGSEVTVTGLAACRAWFGAADPGPGGDGLTDVQ
jgi:RimJ/RimL family protein N-acetyltransferase